MEDCDQHPALFVFDRPNVHQHYILLLGFESASLLNADKSRDYDIDYRSPSLACATSVLHLAD